MTTENAPGANAARERCVLATVLSDPSVIEGIRFLDPSDFYFPTNGEIWAAVLDLVELDEPIDILTVQERLSKKGTEILAADLAAIVDERLPTEIVHHAKAIQRDSYRRKTIE